MAKKSAKENTPVGALPLELMSPDAGNDKTDLVSVLIFDAGENRFAIGVEHTEGVVDCPYLSPLPSAPDGIIGVASVRGRMTLVMALSLDEELNRPKRRLILLKGESQLGLLADHVEGVFAIEPKKLRGATSGKDKSSAREASKVGQSPWPARAYFEHEKRRIPVIDVERLVEV